MRERTAREGGKMEIYMLAASLGLRVGEDGQMVRKCDIVRKAFYVILRD